MPFLDRLRNLISNQSDGQKDDWPSIVMLLREPNLPSAADALQMAREAWGNSHEIELVSSLKGAHHIFRSANLYFALHAARSRYDIVRTELALAQEQPWQEHTAWMAIDLPRHRIALLKAEGSLASAYKTLTYFIHRHWSPNCLAIYFPSEGVTMPNHGDFVQSIRWARQNGIDLDFLKEGKGPPHSA